MLRPLCSNIPEWYYLLISLIVCTQQLGLEAALRAEVEIDGKLAELRCGSLGVLCHRASRDALFCVHAIPLMRMKMKV